MKKFTEKIINKYFYFPIDCYFRIDTIAENINILFYIQKYDDNLYNILVD